MNKVIVTIAAAFVLGSFLLAQEPKAQNSLDQSFASGGTVRLRLSSGNYTIRAGTSDHLLVQSQPRDPAAQREMNRIKVRADISGTIATIQTEGPTKLSRTVIEIPARSDLYLRMRAGDVRIAGIEGNKDVHLTAGDLKIDVLPEAYAFIHASVTVGDVNARPFHASQSGFVRSFEWNGTGKYTLHASLFAGDVVLSHRESAHGY